MQSLVISSGHGLFVRGASRILDEVNEARRVVNSVAEKLLIRGLDVVSFHDDTSHSQSENLETIVDFHNAHERDLDCSVHFNAYENTSQSMGSEVLYLTQLNLASDLVCAICGASGLKNRGPKQRTDLAFLNNTDQIAILIEVCFVDSSVDAGLYRDNFEEICEAIASTLAGDKQPEPPPPPEFEFRALGKASWFGGPKDTGVSPSEGLAFIYAVEDAPHLFLPYQPEGTTGLARRLNPCTHYVACRWDYEKTPKDALLKSMALVRALDSEIELLAFPADWGPHKEKTGRIADLSPSLMVDLGLKTDGEVEVIFPAPIPENLL
jgi:hypothetical protein